MLSLMSQSAGPLDKLPRPSALISPPQALIAPAPLPSGAVMSAGSTPVLPSMATPPQQVLCPPQTPSMQAGLPHPPPPPPPPPAMAPPMMVPPFMGPQMSPFVPNQYVYYPPQHQQMMAPMVGAPGTPPLRTPGSATMPYYYGYSAGMIHPRRKSKQSTTWSPKEDKLLRELKEVQKLGWREISTFFQGRTPNACQFRWRRLINGNSGTATTPAQLRSDSDGKKPGNQSITFLLN